MKKLITLLAIVGFVPSVHAAEGADFSHSGDYRLKYTDSVNNDFAESGTGNPQEFEQRLKLGTDVRAGEKLSTHFTFVHNANWGENPTQVPTVDGTTSKNLLLVNEAYMTWMASDAWMIRAGRGSFTMADGSVISANDYESVANAFDGVMASYDHEMARISAFGVKGGEVTADDRVMANFWGLSADFKSLPSFLKALNVHYMMVKVDEGDYVGIATPNEDSSRMGVTASGDMAGFDYKLTYATWSGEKKSTIAATLKQDISSSMMDAHLGYSLPSLMNSNIHFGYHSDTGSKTADVATGKDETYQGFYYDQHYNAGLMDVLSWGNLTYMTFGASFHPSDDITVGADYYMFTKTEKSDFAYNGTGKLVDAASLTSGDFGVAGLDNIKNSDTTKDDLGTELDLTVAKKYTNNFSISARYGVFSPGDSFKAQNAAMNDTYTQMSVAANLKF